MRFILKYLNKYYKPIIFIVFMIIIQAACDLTLPEYTSKIVNIGIQQSGIEEPIYKKVRKSELDKLKLIMNSNEKKLINSIYEYENNEDIYTLKKISKNEKEKATEIFKNTIYIWQLINYDSEINNLILNKYLKYINSFEFEDQISNVELFYFLPQNVIDEINSNYKETIKNIPDVMLEQLSIQIIKQEYNTLGINVNKIQSNYIITTGIKMISIALVSMFATIVVGYVGAKFSAHFGKRVRKDVYDKVMSFSEAELKQFSTASLITRNTNDIQQIQSSLIMFLRTMVYAPILAIGGIIKIVNTDTSMAWIIGLGVIFIILVVILLFIFAIPKFEIIQKLTDKLNLITREMLKGIPVIRAFSKEKHEEKRFDKLNVEIKKISSFIIRIMGTMMPLMSLTMSLVSILIIYFGAKSIDAGTMQVGNLLAFIQYSIQILMSFLMISITFIMFPRGKVSMDRILEVLDAKISINNPKVIQEIDESKLGYVEFKNVSFKYPDAEEYVITDISFIARPGETTAFIGATGSGKSTIVNLIPRFFDVTEGEILINGVNIKNMSLKYLREQIGYVPQKGVLFSGTISSNIKLGNQNISDEMVKKAAEIAQAKEFIEKKENGYDSQISQGGTNVSGGQKQRLSIARAIAKNPAIYIFDDSFSALDFKTDANLRKALKRATKNSTVLIVSQRISTILNAEQIIVLEDGKIVGKGTHDELIKNCDVYREIAISQLGEEAIKDATRFQK